MSANELQAQLPLGFCVAMSSGTARPFKGTGVSSIIAIT
jgi:hypothetical protein